MSGLESGAGGDEAARALAHVEQALSRPGLWTGAQLGALGELRDDLLSLAATGGFDRIRMSREYLAFARALGVLGDAAGLRAGRGG